MASNLKVDIVRPTATNGSLSLKGDSGGAATTDGIVINNAGNVMVGQTSTTGAQLVVGGYTGAGTAYAASTGIGVSGNSHFENNIRIGNLAGTGSRLVTADSNGTLSATDSVDINGGTIDSATIGGDTPAAGSFTQVNAGDGAEATPSITNTGDTDTGIYFPAADTVGVSTNATERMRIDSSGNVQLTGSLTAGTIGSGIVFPAGHIIQFAQSFTETGGGVIGNLSSVGSGSPATILTATINNVLASSKVFGFFYSGGMILNSGQYIANNVAGGSINMDYINQSGSGNTYLSPTFFFYDDAPGTGTNSYVLKGYSNASGNAAYWCGSGGRAYGWMLFEVAQ